MYFFKRYLALQIDIILSGFIIGPILIVLSFIKPSFFYLFQNKLYISIIYAAGIILYYILMDIILGKSIGKIIFKINVVDFERKRIGKLKMILRDILRIIDLVLLVPMLYVFINEKRQSLSDKIMRTIVVIES